MRWHQAVRQVQETLASRGIEVPRLEAELLVMEALRPFDSAQDRQAQGSAHRQAIPEYVLAIPTSRDGQGTPGEGRRVAGRAWLYAHLQDEFPREAQQALGCLLERRLSGEPLAYIRGHKEFFGLDFLVDKRVLIPRPETETLVEAALSWLQCRPVRIRAPMYRGDTSFGEPVEGRWPGLPLAADIGTGCGAIAISLAVNLPQAIIYATDISDSALEVTEANARRHGVADRVRLRRGDLLEPLPHLFPLIVANLPYVAAPDWPSLAPEVAFFEPRQALHGGEQGLHVIGRLLEQAPSRLLAGGCLLLELGFGQGQAALGLARTAFSKAHLRLLPDLAGIPRVLSIETPEAGP